MDRGAIGSAVFLIEVLNKDFERIAVDPIKVCQALLCIGNTQGFSLQHFLFPELLGRFPPNTVIADNQGKDPRGILLDDQPDLLFTFLGGEAMPKGIFQKWL